MQNFDVMLTDVGIPVFIQCRSGYEGQGHQLSNTPWNLIETFVTYSGDDCCATVRHTTGVGNKMKIAFLVVSLAAVCFGYGKEYIQVYKLVDRGVTMHRLSTHVAEEGKFEPITGENKKNWEISYFSAYKREESISTGFSWIRSSCEFDQKILVCVGNTRLPSGAATRAWFITKNTRCFERTRRAFSFYAAREECNGAQLIYYAACRNSSRTLYGLVGTKSGLCGSDQKAYEGSFYAYIGKTMCPFMDSPKFGSYRQTWDDFRISSLHYECDPGRELRGPRIITCSNDGRWDQSPPTCDGLCDRGYYLNKRTDGKCTPCPIGTYQDQQGQTSCKKCHPTTTTLTEGADHLALCNQRAPAPGEVQVLT